MMSAEYRKCRYVHLGNQRVFFLHADIPLERVKFKRVSGEPFLVELKQSGREE